MVTYTGITNYLWGIPASMFPGIFGNSTSDHTNNTPPPPAIAVNNNDIATTFNTTPIAVNNNVIPTLVTPPPVRLSFREWTALFLVGGFIGVITANLTAHSIKGFTKDKADEETGFEYSQFTNAGEMYAGMMGVGFAIAICAIALMIIQKINEYNAANPKPAQPPLANNHLPLSPPKERLLINITIGSAATLIGMIIAIPTALNTHGLHKEKTTTDYDGKEHQNTVFTNDGIGFVLGLTLGLGVIAFAIACHRQSIASSVGKFVSSFQGSQHQNSQQQTNTTGQSNSH